ncbi:hypothetical protein [Parasitella parasitica]|uniref:SH3 domain-containing protein n=1 Tax=Parasitella parasitica TaxID=35722 RepID=A0A0B7NEY4_9FUNG|nr:hypothetical protein [Parasitella parasitica]
MHQKQYDFQFNVHLQHPQQQQQQQQQQQHEQMIQTSQILYGNRSKQKSLNTSSGQPSAEEEATSKRKLSLERNRLAAYRCRERKKNEQQQMIEQADFLSVQNESLNIMLMILAIAKECNLLSNAPALHCENVPEQIAKTVANAKDPENSCVSLANSKVCSAFAQFYIGLPGLEYDYPFLINTTTIEEFDERLLEYVNSTSDYLFPLGCLSSNYNPIIPYARYSLTRLCVGMIQNPSYSLPCNFNNGLTPPPLCQCTCLEWVDSISRITQNPRVCSDSSQRNTSLASFTDQCNTWEGFNGTITDNCISGIANEPYSCGFGNNTRAACIYCRDNANDECCQQVTYCKHSLSAGTIVGIVIGSSIGAASVLFAGIWYCCRRKHRAHKYPSTQFLSSSNTSTTITTQQQEGRFSNNIKSAPINDDVTFNDSKLINFSLPSRNDRMETIDDDASTAIPTPLEPAAGSTTMDTILNEELFVVVHGYLPQMLDELELNVGDIVCLALHFDDGWALGYNVTSAQKGAFPLVCISPAPEDSLNQLLRMDSQPASMVDISNSNKSAHSNTSSLRATMEKIRESVRRSSSLNSSFQNHNSSIHSSNSLYNISNNDMHHHNTFPQRSASYKSLDYFEIDSPSSPTQHTPFFHANELAQQTLKDEKDSSESRLVKIGSGQSIE